jgi:hypothetical protein
MQNKSSMYLDFNNATYMELNGPLDFNPSQCAMIPNKM